ncbi:hypothetical protein EVAR_53408_1 [Eumeta japonica]|uniref:Uncharacterized protein n=1 Tax=Eumeta variegata TaxID=151549 RepID=A0A4C1XN54_EUMVA|nr:hypothetical protein EVAR_53408_1 [Eumeta japonica]
MYYTRFSYCISISFAANLVQTLDRTDDLEWDRGLVSTAQSSGGKWGGGAQAQDTAGPRDAPLARNGTDSCKLLVYIDDSKNPIWRLPLCGSNAASVAARAGTRLLPPKIKIVWNPPTTPYHHTEKLRLVVTAVNSGAVCNNSSQFVCGTSGLCISSYLVCDGVRHCPSGEDEDAAACSQFREPPFLELLKRFAARNQELLGLEAANEATKPSVISDLTVTVKISDTEQKPNTLVEFNAALKPYGPWGYLVIGMLVCATVLMFCLAWECCCKRSKPSLTPLNVPAACMDLSPTVTITAASQQMVVTQELPPTPPEYEPPPTYSSLFPRAFKSSPTPVPHCSHQEPPD